MLSNCLLNKHLSRSDWALLRPFGNLNSIKWVLRHDSCFILIHLPWNTTQSLGPGWALELFLWLELRWDYLTSISGIKSGWHGLEFLKCGWGQVVCVLLVVGCLLWERIGICLFGWVGMGIVSVELGDLLWDGVWVCKLLLLWRVHLMDAGLPWRLTVCSRWA